MPKSKETSALRQRKKPDNAGGNGDSDSKPETKPAPKKAPQQQGVKSSKGMTCLNWCFVLFLIFAVTGAASFLLFEIIQNEVATIRQKMSNTADLDRDMKTVSKRLESLKRVEKELKTMKENEESKTTDLAKLTLDVTEAKLSFDTAIGGLKKSISAIQMSKSTTDAVTKLQDQMKVTSADVAQLTKELIRIDKRYNDQFEQVSSVQQDVINLTADKVAMKTAIESIKSTIVSVRDVVETLQSGEKSADGATTDSLLKRIDAIDAKLTTEVDRLSRQLSETSENSAKWLQTSTNELEQRFQKNVEDLTKQFSEVKTETQNTGEATADQSVLNSVAALESRLNEVKESVTRLKEIVTTVDENQKKATVSTTEQMGETAESLTKLTDHVLEAKSRDQGLANEIDDLTQQVTTIRNELNGVRTTAKILESRVEEIRTGTKEKAPEPAIAPDMPADAIPDPNAK